MTKTIVIKSDITGAAIFGIIRRAMREYSKETGLTATLSDFCTAAVISRQQLYLYRRGHVPSTVGINKVADGLRAWGYTVEL